MTKFHDAFLEARRQIEEHGKDPEVIVPPLLELAEAPEEIELARDLYGDDDEDELQ